MGRFRPFCLFATAMAMALFPPGVLAAGEPLSVAVSILPQKTFVERIGGERVEVFVMVPPGASPHTYEPKPRQMVQLSKTRLYLAIGVPFETAWLDRIAAANPSMRIVHTEEGIQKRMMKRHYHFQEEPPHPAGETDRSPVQDPHIWTSPPLVMQLARNILASLVAADPDSRMAYFRNYEKMMDELVRIDAELMETFSRKGSARQFMVFHPAWGYFAHAYGLEQVPIEIEGKTPKPAQLRLLISHAREQGIRVIFVQPQFSSQTAQVIAREIGGEVVFADPLAPDWFDNLRRQAEQFRNALR